jgi:hypothetical protein
MGLPFFLIGGAFCFGRLRAFFFCFDFFKPDARRRFVLIFKDSSAAFNYF